MLGSYLKVHLVYMQKTLLCSMLDLCSAWLQSKVAGDNDKSLVLGVLLSLLALRPAFFHDDISNTATVNYEQHH